MGGNSPSSHYGSTKTCAGLIPHCLFTLIHESRSRQGRGSGFGLLPILHPPRSDPSTSLPCSTHPSAIHTHTQPSGLAFSHGHFLGIHPLAHGCGSQYLWQQLACMDWSSHISDGHKGRFAGSTHILLAYFFNRIGS